MLGLGVDPDALALGEVDDLLERRDLVDAVEGRVGRSPLGQPLDRAQRLELAQREVLGEPAGDAVAVDRLRLAAGGELRMLRNVGRARDVVLVAGDEQVVLGRDEVGLDVVRAHVDRQLVGAERVLGPVGRRAAMADDERRGAVVRVIPGATPPR